MIIMDYCSSDLTHYITKEFYNISWSKKLEQLGNIINGLYYIHDKNIVHRDFHSGNILIKNAQDPKISDLGLSKSATGSTGSSDDNENYGIIPYMAPEIF